MTKSNALLTNSMTLGFDGRLYFLPFDHRASMQTKMFGWTGPLNAAQIGEIAGAKRKPKSAAATITVKTWNRGSTN